VGQEDCCKTQILVSKRVAIHQAVFPLFLFFSKKERGDIMEQNNKENCKDCRCLECDLNGAKGIVSCDRCDWCTNEDLKITERGCLDD